VGPEITIPGVNAPYIVLLNTTFSSSSTTTLSIASGAAARFFEFNSLRTDSTFCTAMANNNGVSTFRSYSGTCLLWPIGSAERANTVGGTAGFDQMWPDSTNHRWIMNNNNGSDVQVVASGADINTSDQVTVTPPSGPLAHRSRRHQSELHRDIPNFGNSGRHDCEWHSGHDHGSHCSRVLWNDGDCIGNGSADYRLHLLGVQRGPGSEPCVDSRQLLAYSQQRELSVLYSGRSDWRHAECSNLKLEGCSLAIRQGDDVRRQHVRVDLESLQVGIEEFVLKCCQGLKYLRAVSLRHFHDQGGARLQNVHSSAQC
jgi:hypothetical protein